jgi:hypothetical protein
MRHNWAGCGWPGPSDNPDEVNCYTQLLHNWVSPQRMEREHSGRRRSGRNDGHIEQVGRGRQHLWSPWGCQLRHCSCHPSVGHKDLELLHHLTRADLPRRIDCCNQILRFVHEEDLAKLQVLTGKPKSIAIEKCRLFLDQSYVTLIIIECIVMRLVRTIFL